MKFAIILLTLLTTCFSNVSQADQYSMEEIIHTELLFNNCEKAHTIIDATNNLSSPTAKDNLTKYISRILGIETSNFQITKPPAGAISSPNTNLNISNYLDPERDKKAKLCALSILQKIDPFSAATIPQLIKLGSDRKNNSEIRDQALYEMQRQNALIQRQHFPEYILKDIYSHLEQEEQLLESSYASILLLGLSQKVALSYSKLLEPQNSTLRDHVLTAFVINQYKNPNAITEIASLYGKLDEGSKAQLISKLKYISDNQPLLIELLPDFLNSDSPLVRNETIKLVTYMNQNSAYYAAFYDKKALSYSALQKYLEHIKISEMRSPDHKNSDINLGKEIIKLLLPIRLKNDHELCAPNATFAENLNPHDLNHDTNTLLLINSLCPYRKEIKTSFFNSVLRQDYTQSVLGLILLSIHEEIDEELLINSLKYAKDIKKKYSPKEFSLFSYLILRAANKISTSKIKPSLVNLAIENIENDTSGSSLIDTFLPTKSNPGTEYLTSNLKISDSLLQKKLLEKSPLLIKKILSIYANPETEKVTLSQQTNSQLTKLLNSESLEIRRNAYVSLKLHKLDNSKITFPQTTNSPVTQFYISRILLDNENISQDKNREQIIKSFISSLAHLDCRERTISFPKYITSNLHLLSKTEKESLIQSQIQCIKESTFTRLRSIKNATLFDDLEQSHLRTIVSDFITAKDIHNESQSALLLLDYLSKKDLQLVIEILQATLGSKQEDNIRASLDWLLRNKINALNQNEIILKAVSELSDSDAPQIHLQATLLRYAMIPSEDNLSDLKKKIIKNIDQTELIINLPIRSVYTKELVAAALKELNSYYSVYLNTSLCAEIGESTFCEQIKLSPSMIYDKGGFYKIILKNLAHSPHAAQPHLKNTMKMLIVQLIDNGHIEELLSLTKTIEMISLLKEIRIDTSNLVHSKILDFLLEN